MQQGGMQQLVGRSKRGEGLCNAMYRLYICSRACLDAQVRQARDHALLELREGDDGARHQARLLQEDLGGAEGHGVQKGGQPAGERKGMAYRKVGSLQKRGEPGGGCWFGMGRGGAERCGAETGKGGEGFKAGRCGVQGGAGVSSGRWTKPAWGTGRGRAPRSAPLSRT